MDVKDGNLLANETVTSKFIDISKLKSEDDILKELKASKILNDLIKISNENPYHQGGNVKKPIDFEEALKFTVPYNKKL